MVTRSTVLCLASPDAACRRAALHACLKAPIASLRAHNYLLFKMISEDLPCEIHVNAVALLSLPEIEQYGRDQARGAWLTAALEPCSLSAPDDWDSALLISACSVCSQLELQSSWPRKFITALAQHHDREVASAARGALAAPLTPSGDAARIDDSEEAMHTDCVTLLAEASAHCAEQCKRTGAGTASQFGFGRRTVRDPEWDTEVCRLMEDESLQPLLELEGGDEEARLAEQPDLAHMPCRLREEKLLQKVGFHILRREGPVLPRSVIPYPTSNAAPHSRPPPHTSAEVAAPDSTGSADRSRHAPPSAAPASRQAPPPARRRPERPGRTSMESPYQVGGVTPIVAMDIAKMSLGSSGGMSSRRYRAVR